MFIQIDSQSSTPVFEQIVREIKSAVARGACRPGDVIPPVRQLAKQLLVNPNTVAKAYRDLERDGVLTTRRGAGVFVALGARKLCHDERRRDLHSEMARVIAEAQRAGMSNDEIARLIKQLLNVDTNELAIEQ